MRPNPLGSILGEDEAANASRVVHSSRMQLALNYINKIVVESNAATPLSEHEKTALAVFGVKDAEQQDLAELSAREYERIVNLAPLRSEDWLRTISSTGNAMTLQRTWFTLLAQQLVTRTVCVTAWMISRSINALSLAAQYESNPPDLP